MKSSNKQRAMSYSRKLKKNATLSEILLRDELKKRGLFFWFQKTHPKGTYKKGFYIPDFTFRIDKRSYLFVEIDGGYHNTPTQIKKDKEREIKLTHSNNQIIRFTNKEVQEDINRVINKILSFKIM